MDAKGVIAFTTVGVMDYGFDVFSTALPPDLATDLTDTRCTDGVSVNFNAQFADDGEESVVFVSERTGSAQLFYQPSSPGSKPKLLPTNPKSVFHDRPTIRNGCLVYVSAHETPSQNFKSWAAVYSTRLDTEETIRLTPAGFVDFSPAVSESGQLVSVASYGQRPWKGDFRVLSTEIAVFPVSDPRRRTVIAVDGGWPSFSGETTIFFHRKADDGWWSVYCIDLDKNQNPEGTPRRITPPGVHAFTPSASHDGKLVAVATRRKGSNFRHIEIFELESGRFLPITERVSPNFHHYNPFFSKDSTRLGYHRFRGKSEETKPDIQHVTSPIDGLRLLRLNGSFPSFSPAGDLLAITGDFLNSSGLMILRSDGTKLWTLLKKPVAFSTAWSPKEKGVIFTSIGPIFESITTTVEIARVSFNPEDLKADDGGEDVPAVVKILTSGGAGNNAFPSCSPDGRHVVFRSGRSGHKNLYIIDAIDGEFADGGGIRRLTEGEWVDTMPSWSPDGDLIAFSSNRHNPSDLDAFSIYLVRPDGSDLRRVQVAADDAIDRERINHVCFSPDSKWLLFTANLGSVSAEPVSLPNHFQPYGDLWICRLDGTQLARLTCNAYENGTPAWHSSKYKHLLSSQIPAVGGTLTGQFEEPLWLTCDV